MVKIKASTIVEHAVMLTMLFSNSLTANIMSSRELSQAKNLKSNAVHDSKTNIVAEADIPTHDQRLTKSVLQAAKAETPYSLIFNSVHDRVFQSVTEEELAHSTNTKDNRKHKRRHRKQLKKMKTTGKGTVIKRRHRRHNKRQRNRHFRLGLGRRSCPILSSYVFKSEAEDMFGDTVKVYPSIHIGSISIDQYVYESFCDVEKCKCNGIDTANFKSSCETDFRYTYARVIKGDEIGWTHIKARSGCSCIVRERHPAPGQISILDLI